MNKLFAVVLLGTGCSAAHEVDHPPVMPACEDPSVDANELDEEQRVGLMNALHHEMLHLADYVESVAAGPSVPNTDWDLTEDHGGMIITVRGESRLSGGEVEDRAELIAEVDFTHFTGGHGGWGYAALDGHACVTISAFAYPGDRESARSTITLSGVLELLDDGDGPLQGAPRTNVSYTWTSDGGLIEATVGGEPFVPLVGS